MNDGFFKEREIKEMGGRAVNSSYDCEKCGLCKSVNSPKMEPHGHFQKNMINLWVMLENISMTISTPTELIFIEML